jgi:NAD(P)-dependent dehydrogenase (short-subunit alcohol dehydrogenase family)
MFCPFQLSQDGIELQFQTNHLGMYYVVSNGAYIDNCLLCCLIGVFFLGHFFLTNLLLDKMKKTAKSTGIEGRIINLSSIAHTYTYEEGIRLDNINDQIGYAC